MGVVFYSYRRLGCRAILVLLPNSNPLTIDWLMQLSGGAMCCVEWNLGKWKVQYMCTRVTPKVSGWGDLEAFTDFLPSSLFQSNSPARTYLVILSNHVTMAPDHKSHPRKKIEHLRRLETTSPSIAASLEGTKRKNKGLSPGKRGLGDQLNGICFHIVQGGGGVVVDQQAVGAVVWTTCSPSLAGLPLSHRCASLVHYSPEWHTMATGNTLPRRTIKGVYNSFAAIQAHIPIKDK